MKCPNCYSEGAYVGISSVKCLNKGCQNFHDVKMPDPIEVCNKIMNPIEVCNRIMSTFLEQTSVKDQISAEEAAVAVEIKKVLESITIIKLGDAKNGFLPPPKAFSKMIDLMKTKKEKPWDHWILVWDDLISKAVVDAVRVEVD